MWWQNWRAPTRSTSSSQRAVLLLTSFLVVLLLLGIGVLAAFTAAGDAPSRTVVWLLLVWVFALLALVATLQFLLRPRNRT